MFDQIIHADWGKDPRKRWSAKASRCPDGWLVDAPQPVGPITPLFDSLFAESAHARILVGFDFPIGVPLAYGALTKLGDFRELLGMLGEGDWVEAFDVAHLPSEISVFRPFYPYTAKKGVSPSDLVSGLGLNTPQDLLRVCERRTHYRQAACALFWTLGGNQVGKGALAGWKEAIRPALSRGALLWPFDGQLAKLASSPGIVLAETYPAEAYRLVGASFNRRESKRRQADRRQKSSAITAWAHDNAVKLSNATVAAIRDGFGPTMSGEDQFDALLGLFKMIKVAEGRCPECTEWNETITKWEGWILGR